MTGLNFLLSFVFCMAVWSVGGQHFLFLFISTVFSPPSSDCFLLSAGKGESYRSATQIEIEKLTGPWRKLTGLALGEDVVKTGGKNPTGYG